MALFKNARRYPATTAVVVAAGQSSRMAGVDKLMYELGGLPVLMHTLLAAEASRAVSRIVLVCRAEQIAEYFALVGNFEISKMGPIVAGGQTRQQSVFAGMATLQPDAEYICMLDGARPLVTPDIIDSCVECAMEHGAASASVPLKDTIKRVDGSGLVVATPDRSEYRAVQTPQVFKRTLYEAAMRGAQAAGADYTDDCQLIEAAGAPVYLCEGSYTNIKITTPEDLAIAQALYYGPQEVEL